MRWADETHFVEQLMKADALTAAKKSKYFKDMMIHHRADDKWLRRGFVMTIKFAIGAGRGLQCLRLKQPYLQPAMWDRCALWVER